MFDWRGAVIKLGAHWSMNAGGPGLSTIIMPLLSENEHTPQPSGPKGPTTMIG